MGTCRESVSEVGCAEETPASESPTCGPLDYGNAAFAEDHLGPPPAAECGPDGGAPAHLEQLLAQAGTSDPARVRSLRDDLAAAHADAEDGWCVVVVPPERPVLVSEPDVATLLDTAERLLAAAEALAHHAEATDEAAGRVPRHDLGEVTSIGSFCDVAGSLVDLAIADEGDQANLRICANFPVEPGVFAGLDFQLEAQRNGGVTLRAQLGAALTARASAWVVEAFLRAEVYGFLEVQGDSGEDAMRLMLYGIETSVAAVSEDLAGAMFDRRFVRAAERGLDDGDYVDVGVGVDVSAGAFAPGAGVTEEAEAGVYDSLRIARGADGALEATDYSGERAQLHLEFHHFDLQGEVVARQREGEFDQVALEVVGGHDMSFDQWQWLVAGRGVEALLPLLGAALMDLVGSPGPGGDADGAFYELARVLDSVTGVTLLGTAGLIEATGGDESPLSVAHELRVNAVYQANGHWTVSLAVARNTSLEFGDHPTDPFYAQLQHIDPLLTFTAAGDREHPARMSAHL